MSKQSMADKLFTIRYKCDENSHLSIKNAEACIRCGGKECNTFCPAEVYEWDKAAKVTHVAFENCVECGTCRIACPGDNIGWVYPKGGYGISYRFG
ncbi:MAG: 4Fe-4S dicluster protein [Paenibacillaceae bacterium]|jgi:ferredoxin like protein|nr:4Fe-4S dicluster protein [Paenibacillaceae bacterium]